MKVTPDHIAQARRINMIEYLRQLGHQPVQARADHALFHSPLRSDRNPSFSVSLVDGAWVWFDFALQTHGDLIDFIQARDHVTFKEALTTVLREPPLVMRAVPKPTTAIKTPTDNERILYARKLYHTAQASMTAEREEQLRHYFAERHLPFYSHMGAVWLPLTLHSPECDTQRQEEARTTPKGKSDRLPCLHINCHPVPYIAFPLPTPNVHFIQGLMCRAIGDVPHDRLRLWRGVPSPWVLRRKQAPMLVTESIIDCLAADVLFGPSFTLCALNGLGQSGQLLAYLERLQTKVAYLALDNDPDPQKGPRVQKQLVETLTTHGMHVMEVQTHHHSRTKDLHKHLLACPSRISVFELTKTGVHHQARR